MDLLCSMRLEKVGDRQPEQGVSKRRRVQDAGVVDDREFRHGLSVTHTFVLRDASQSIQCIKPLFIYALFVRQHIFEAHTPM